MNRIKLVFGTTLLNCFITHCKKLNIIVVFSMLFTVTFAFFTINSQSEKNGSSKRNYTVGYMKNLFSEVDKRTGGKKVSEKDILEEIQVYRIEKRTRKGA